MSKPVRKWVGSTVPAQFDPEVLGRGSYARPSRPRAQPGPPNRPIHRPLRRWLARRQSVGPFRSSGPEGPPQLCCDGWGLGIVSVGRWALGGGCQPGPTLWPWQSPEVFERVPWNSTRFLIAPPEVSFLGILRNLGGIVPHLSMIVINYLSKTKLFFEFQCNVIPTIATEILCIQRNGTQQLDVS